MKKTIIICEGTRITTGIKCYQGEDYTTAGIFTFFGDWNEEIIEERLIEYNWAIVKPNKGEITAFAGEYRGKEIVTKYYCPIHSPEYVKNFVDLSSDKTFTKLVEGLWARVARTDGYGHITIELSKTGVGLAESSDLTSANEDA
jgi:hypothetical protein